MSLTPEQQAAVTRSSQDVCVVAGPGSGKTRVLVERYLWLLDHHQFTPAQILVITFTEKAAQELKERLTHRVAHDPARRAELERAPITTIHGYGARLLRRYAVAASLDPAFRILDERAAHLELTSALRGELDRWAIERPAELRLLLAAWNTHDPVSDLAELYDSWRTSGGLLHDLRRTAPLPSHEAAELLAAAERAIQLARVRVTKAIADRLPNLTAWTDRLRAASPHDPDRWLAALADFDFSLSGLHQHPVNPAIKELRERRLRARVHAIARAALPARRILTDIFAAATAAYERRKESLSGVDFGDLESRAISLLERHPAIRDFVRDEFQSILMDELQDTNPLQWRLVDLLRRPGRFFAVGDINQSIFGFRHADPAAFRLYRDSLLAAGHAVDRLTGNFRSRPEILAAVTAIVDQAAGIESPDLVAAASFEPSPSPPVEAQLILEDDREIRAAREADWMARRIRELIRDGASYGDIAILFRSTTELAEFERAFRSWDIPFVLTRGQRFFEQQEVADLLNWLRVLDNPRHELALAAVLRSPLLALDDASLLLWRDRHSHLADALAAELPAFAAWLELERHAASSTPPDQLLAHILDRSGYELTLDSRGLNNVDKLLTLVRDWWNDQPRPLSHLIRYLEDLRVLSDEPNAPAFGEANAVRILTVHASKGLEFPIVFLASLQRRGDSRPPSLSFSREFGLGVDWRDPLEGGSSPDPTHTQNLDARAAAETEEANRLLYVAMTRAQSRLIFSTTDGMRAWAAPVLRVVPPRELSGAPPRWDLLSLAAPSTPQFSFDFDSREAATPNVEWIPPLPPAPALPASLSVTELLAFHAGESTAPLLAAPHTDRDDPTEIGRQTHWLLEHGPSTPLPPAFDPVSLELARRFWSSPLHARALNAIRREREFDFQFEFDGLILSGQIDLWFEEPNGNLVLIDYKTDRVTADDAIARAEHYSLQLAVYAAALTRLTGRAPAELYLYFLEIDRAIPVAPAPDLMPDSLRRWRNRNSSAPASSAPAPPIAGTAPFPVPPSVPDPDRS